MFALIAFDINSISQAACLTLLELSAREKYLHSVFNFRATADSTGNMELVKVITTKVFVSD